MRFVGLIGPSYTLSSVNVDCQRCVNLYPELNEIGTGKEKEVASLRATPGLSLLAVVGAGPHRGEYTASNGSLFVVSGATLFQVSASFVATSLGTLSTTTGPVSMADNGANLCVVDGPNGYVWTFATSNFLQITDPAFPGADQVAFQDGYFIFNKPNSGSFFISGLDAITFDALDIATSEGNPDNIIGLISDHRDLWMFNSQTTEVFFNSGAADFPFERIQGAFIEQGCAARFSIAKMGSTVFWLGQDDKGTGQVFQAQGYQPKRISTHAVEQAIQGYASLSTATAYVYQDGGHQFYVLNFAEASWAFDMTTNLWHERAYTNGGILERHRASCHAFAFGKHIVGDYVNGNLYQLNQSSYDDNGTAITRMRVSPHVSQDMNRMFYSKFQLDIETGTGLDGLGQGVDPQVMLQFSDDGGHSWSNEKWASFGKIGARLSRAIWRRLGQSRDRVFKIVITDPVKVAILGAEIDVMEGAS